MKLLRIIGRNIRDSFKGVFRNFSLSMASISCITITLIVVAISIILSYNVTNFMKQLEKEVTIIAFLEDKISEEKIEEVYENINILNNIETIDFKGKMEAAKEVMEEEPGLKSLMEEWSEEESPVLHSYTVKVDDIEVIGEVANQIKEIEGVDSVKYGEGKVEELAKTFTVITNVSAITVIALVLVTAFLISNTIKITIFSRRREIEIMRLVGASNTNIKTPFVFEGLLLGIMGSLIPIGLTIYGYVFIYRNFKGNLFRFALFKFVEPEPFIYKVSLILLTIGIVVGIFGSVRAVKKHLKV